MFNINREYPKYFSPIILYNDYPNSSASTTPQPTLKTELTQSIEQATSVFFHSNKIQSNFSYPVLPQNKILRDEDDNLGEKKKSTNELGQSILQVTSMLVNNSPSSTNVVRSSYANEESNVEEEKKMTKITKRKNQLWTAKDDQRLTDAIEATGKFKGKKVTWKTVAERVPGRTSSQCQGRYRLLTRSEEGLLVKRVRSVWKPSEDSLLIKAVKIFKRWTQRAKFITKESGIPKNRKQCRARWERYLNPNLNHAPYSEAELEKLIELVRIRELNAKGQISWSSIARDFNKGLRKVRSPDSLKFAYTNLLRCGKIGEKSTSNTSESQKQTSTFPKEPSLKTTGKASKKKRKRKSSDSNLIKPSKKQEFSSEPSGITFEPITLPSTPMSKNHLDDDHSITHQEIIPAEGPPMTPLPSSNDQITDEEINNFFS